MICEVARGARHKAMYHEPCAISQMPEATERNLRYPDIFKIYIIIIRFLGSVMGQLIYSMTDLGKPLEDKRIIVFSTFLGISYFLINEADGVFEVEL